MLIVTIANFFAILIAFWGRILRKEKLYFLIAIIFLICFYSIRTDYGNDFSGYEEIFERTNLYNFANIEDNGDQIEIGWKVLNLIFAPFGFQALIAFLTIIQFFTIYWLISKYAHKTNYWVILALYVLNSNLLLTDLSMLRQALAMHICCWSIPFILNPKFIKSVIIIFLATTFHSSAFVAFLLLVIPFLFRIKPRIIIIVFVSLFCVLMILESVVGDILQLVFANEQFEKYQNYENDKVIAGSGLGILFQLGLCVWLLFRHNNNPQNSFFNISLCIGVLTIPFAFSVQMFSRIGMYFNLIGLISYNS